MDCKINLLFYSVSISPIMGGRAMFDEQAPILFVSYVLPACALGCTYITCYKHIICESSNCIPQGVIFMTSTEFAPNWMLQTGTDRYYIKCSISQHTITLQASYSHNILFLPSRKALHIHKRVLTQYLTFFSYIQIKLY